MHHTSWICGGQNGTLQHWKVDANGMLFFKRTIRHVSSLQYNNAGHDWPSKTINFDMLAAGMGPQPIEANDIVTEFFDQFSLSD